MPQYLLIFIAGVFIGNFATTIFHRLPRNIILYGFNAQTTQPPFCSKCKHLLKFYEYLPIFSWISTRGFCNYCHMPITLSYFLLELIGGIFAIICTILHSNNIENYIIIFCFYMIASLACFIAYIHKSTFIEITMSLLFTGILYRTLNDHSILPWLVMLSLSSITSLYILRNNVQDIYRQQAVHILLPASVWLLLPWNILFIIGWGLIICITTHSYRHTLILLMLMVFLQNV